MLQLLSILLVTIGAIVFIALTIFISVFQFYAFAIGHWKGAPFVQSNKRQLHTMLRFADVKIGDVVVDLGSGNGVVLIEAARNTKKAVGVEMNPFLVWYSRFRIKRLGLTHTITIHKGDLYKFALYHTDVVFLYLLPRTVARLQEKLLRELKPGSRVVSNGFPLPQWHAIKEESNVYLYHIPTK